MNKLKKLLEERAILQAELNGIIDKASKEERAISEEESKAFDDAEKAIKSIDDSIKMEERARDLALKVTSNEKRNTLEVEERAAAEEAVFASYLRGILEERADVNMTVGDNGAVIPSTIANRVIKKVYDICPIYQLSTKYPVGGTLNIPYYDESTQQITMAYATESNDLESTSGKFSTIQLTGFLAGALCKVSKSLMNNSNFDIVSFVVAAMADSISRWIESQLLNGTSGKITGLSGTKQKIIAASSTAITADELIDVQESIPDIFTECIWIMSRATRKAIRKLKDNDGNYLLNKDSSSRWGYTLFGKDIYTSSNSKDMAAGNTVIYYGDFSGLATKISEDISIEVLRERYAAQHVVGVIGWLEIDSKIENEQKIAALVMKAAS